MESVVDPPDPAVAGRAARSRRAAWLAMLAAAGLALAVLVSLTWPLVLEPGSTLPISSFGPSQAWSLRIVPDSLAAGELALRTREAGWPWLRESRYLGWAPLLAGSLLRPVLSPLAIFNLLMFAAPPLGALACALWVRRLVPGVRPASLLLAATTYACSVHLLANVTNGELAKAWSFLVPLALLALEAATRSWRWLPALAVAAVAVVFTEPYAFLCVGLAAPVLVVRRPTWGTVLRVAACAVLLGAAAWLGAQYYRHPDAPWTALFSPSAAPGPARECLGAPYASAPLLGLVRPAWMDVPSGTQHGLYLTWTVLGLALAGAIQSWRTDRGGTARALALAATGLLFSLGPWLFLDPARPALMPLPGAVMEAVMPEHWGGMYYRFLHVGLLGLALLVARLRLPAWSAVAVLLAFGGELRLSARQGWPVALEPPPPADLIGRMTTDPVPGAVVLLPSYLHGETLSTRAFHLALFHGRPITALPRPPTSPAEYPPQGVWMDRCAEGGDCWLPPSTRKDLEDAGIRYVVLRLDHPVPAVSLRALLEAHLGPSARSGQLAWWVLDAAPPEVVIARHPGAPPNQPPPRVYHAPRASPALAPPGGGGPTTSAGR